MAASACRTRPSPSTPTRAPGSGGPTGATPWYATSPARTTGTASGLRSARSTTRTRSSRCASRTAPSSRATYARSRFSGSRTTRAIAKACTASSSATTRPAACAATSNTRSSPETCAPGRRTTRSGPPSRSSRTRSPAESSTEEHGLPLYRGVRSNRKTLNSGPVTGAGDRAIPIGGGGGTAVIGRLIEPPSYVPPATGAPNRSCTFRTA